jgi:hypothetical protein
MALALFNAANKTDPAVIVQRTINQGKPEIEARLENGHPLEMDNRQFDSDQGYWK